MFEISCQEMRDEQTMQHQQKWGPSIRSLLTCHSDDVCFLSRKLNSKSRNQLINAAAAALIEAATSSLLVPRDNDGSIVLGVITSFSLSLQSLQALSLRQEKNLIALCPNWANIRGRKNRCCLVVQSLLGTHTLAR